MRGRIQSIEESQKRRPADVQTEHHGGRKVLSVLSEDFRSSWSAGIFPHPSLGFTENEPKEREYPVSGRFLCENAVLPCSWQEGDTNSDNPSSQQCLQKSISENKLQQQKTTLGASAAHTQSPKVATEDWTNDESGTKTQRQPSCLVWFGVMLWGRFSLHTLGLNYQLSIS